MPLFVDGRVDGPNDRLAFGRDGRNVLEGLGDGLPSDGEAVAVQQPRLQQHLHDLRNAAHLVEFGDDELARGLEVTEDRRLAPNALEVIDGPGHLGCMGNGQEMQHGIGGPAGGHDHTNRILDGASRDDVARLDALANGLDQHTGRCGRALDLLVVFIGHGGGVRQAHAHGLEGRAHGVGGVHAAAGAGAWAGLLFDGLEVLLGQSPSGELTDGLKGRDDGEVFALVVSGLDRAPVNIDGGHVGSCDGHHAARHVLVAAADDQHAVHPLPIHAGLNAVGNHLAGHQGVLHALRAHADAVGDGGRAKELRVGPGLPQGGHGRIGQWLKPTVAGGDGGVSVGHADHGFGEVFLLVAHGVVHGAVGCTGHTGGDILGAIVEGHGLVERGLKELRLSPIRWAVHGPLAHSGHVNSPRAPWV